VTTGPRRAIVVLGAAVLSDGRPSPPMKRRVRHAVELHGSLEDSVLVMSGGVGKYGPSEASVMRDMAVAEGVSSSDILLEENSLTTRQNLQNSNFIIRRMSIAEMHVVTDDFHIRRCRLYAALARIPAEFHGAPSRDRGEGSARLAFYQLREAIGLAKYAWVGLADRYK
jgi:uncharacterized SAM-binding protein YcdF (DUF218 family)